MSSKINNSESGSGLNEYVMSLFDASLTWNDIKWLKRLLDNFVKFSMGRSWTELTELIVSCSITKLPIVLKGILTPQDALLAIEYGASAIVVSNHGARQVDTIPATVCYLFL